MLEAYDLDRVGPYRCRRVGVGLCGLALYRGEVIAEIETGEGGFGFRNVARRVVADADVDTARNRKQQAVDMAAAMAFEIVVAGGDVEMDEAVDPDRDDDEVELALDPCGTGEEQR